MEATNTESALLVVHENGSETLQPMNGEQSAAQGASNGGGIQMVSLNTEPGTRSGPSGPLDRVIEDLVQERESRLGDTLAKEVAALVPLIQNQVRLFYPLSPNALITLLIDY